MRLLHAVAFSKKLHWLTQTKVITLKMQLHAVNACVKRLSQRSLRKHDQLSASKYSLLRSPLFLILSNSIQQILVIKKKD